MPTEIVLVMESDLYGREEFRYDTQREAEAGMARLKAKTKFLKDGVERNFYFA